MREWQLRAAVGCDIRAHGCAPNCSQQTQNGRNMIVANDNSSDDNGNGGMTTADTNGHDYDNMECEYVKKLYESVQLAQFVAEDRTLLSEMHSECGRSGVDLDARAPPAAMAPPTLNQLRHKKFKDMPSCARVDTPFSSLRADGYTFDRIKKLEGLGGLAKVYREAGQQSTPT